MIKRWLICFCFVLSIGVNCFSLSFSPVCSSVDVRSEDYLQLIDQNHIMILLNQQMIANMKEQTNSLKNQIQTLQQQNKNIQKREKVIISVSLLSLIGSVFIFELNAINY